MSGLRLGRLPDRTPVKLTLALAPELHQQLSDYEAAYAETYGVEEPVAELIPAMLAAFLKGDPGFARYRKGAAAS